MTFQQLNAIQNPVEGLMVYWLDCTIEGSAAITIYHDGIWRLVNIDNCNEPSVPFEGSHIPATTQITWNWNEVPIVLGYKWNTIDDYATSINLGITTTFTETGLTCETIYTRYLWAYNGCGHSTSVTLTQSTLNCSFCGDPITVDHLAGDVAPVDKTITYGTVTNIPGETSKCWITSNLGADHQAAAVNDATEASAGWYWQFNRKQGFKHDGTTRTPNTTWITPINEYSTWTTANDPCAIELGTGWRIPTAAEWTSVDRAGGWNNYNGPWNSDLKMHRAGRLDYFYGTLADRGSKGYYWSSDQTSLLTQAQFLIFNSSSCSITQDHKSYGQSIRCLKD